MSYDKAGTYGPVTGVKMVENNVIINSPNVTLRNMHIKGNLTIGEGVGEGDVTLNNVTVDGDTYVKGGGKNSIHINGGSYANIIVQQTSSGQVRIVAIGTDGLAVVISEDAKGEDIILEGTYESVKIEAPDVKVSTQGDTSIGEFMLAEGSTGSQITLDSKTTVDKLVLDEKADVKGQGTVKEADVNKDGVTFEKAPDKQVVDPGVAPPVVTPPVVPVTPTPTPTPGGGGGNYTPSVATASNARIILKEGDSVLTFDKPANMTGIKIFYVSLSKDNGATWENSFSIDKAYDLSVPMSIASQHLSEATTKYNKVKVVSEVEVGGAYKQSQVTMDFNFTITKAGSELAINVTENELGNFEIELPAAAQNGEVYVVHQTDAQGNLSKSYIYPKSIVFDKIITVSNDAKDPFPEGFGFKVSKITGATATAISATVLQKDAVKVVQPTVTVSTVEQDPGKTGGNSITYSTETKTFGGTIDYYAADESLGRTEGNRVGVKITAPSGTVIDKTNATFKYINSSGVETELVNGTTNWMDGEDFVYYYPLVTTVPQTSTVVIDWDGSGIKYAPETIEIKIATDATLSKPEITVSTVEQDPGKTGGNSVTYSTETKTFGGTIDYYATDENLGRTEGNRVGVKITAPSGTVIDKTNATFKYINSSGVETELVNGTTNWMDGENFVYYYPLVTAVPQTSTVVIDWDGSGIKYAPETITINISQNTELKPETDTVKPVITALSAVLSDQSTVAAEGSPLVLTLPLNAVANRIEITMSEEVKVTNGAAVTFNGGTNYNQTYIYGSITQLSDDKTKLIVTPNTSEIGTAGYLGVYTFSVEANAVKDSSENGNEALSFTLNVILPAPISGLQEIVFENNKTYAETPMFLAYGLNTENTTGPQKPSTLAEVKEFIEEKYAVTFNSDAISFSNNTMSINGSILNAADWGKIKASGDPYSPYKITLLASGENKTKIAKIAMYQDGNTVIENIN